jgi:hypothetical protein
MIRQLWLALAFCLLSIGPAAAQGGMGPGPGTVHTVSGGGYAGPLDAVAGATFCWSIRACSAALATANTKLAALNRTSDNATCDILAASTGSLGLTANCGVGGNNGKTAAAFAGTDASGSGSITGTTLTFTGGHIGDTVTGGTTAAYTVITGGSSPTWTVFPSQTVVSTTLTLTVGLTVGIMYEQVSGVTIPHNATVANQPQLLTNGTVPQLFYNASNSATLFNNDTIIAQPFTMVEVSERLANFSSQQDVFMDSGNFTQSIYAASPNTTSIFAGNAVSATANDGVLHSMQKVFNGASSIIAVDGTNTTGLNFGTNGFPGGDLFVLGSNSGASSFCTCYIPEFLLYSSALTTTQNSSLNSNVTTYGW